MNWSILLGPETDASMGDLCFHIFQDSLMKMTINEGINSELIE